MTVAFVLGVVLGWWILDGFLDRMISSRIL